jgi:hypothetical protein
MLQLSDVNDMVDYWSNYFSSVLDLVAPVKSKVKNQDTKKVTDPTTLKLIAEKKRLKNELLLECKLDSEILQKYKKCRNRCNNLIKAQHRKAMGTYLTDGSSINEVWKTVNSIIKPKKNNKTLSVQVGEKLIEEPVKVADELNNFFKEKIEKLVNKIDKSQLENPLQKLKNNLSDRNLKFSLQPVDIHKVLEILSKLKPKTSCGLDGISSEMIKMCKEEVAGP